MECCRYHINKKGISQIMKLWGSFHASKLKDLIFYLPKNLISLSIKPFLFVCWKPPRINKPNSSKQNGNCNPIKNHGFSENPWFKINFWETFGTIHKKPLNETSILLTLDLELPSGCCSHKLHQANGFVFRLLETHYIFETAAGILIALLASGWKHIRSSVSNRFLLIQKKKE